MHAGTLAQRGEAGEVSTMPGAARGKPLLESKGIAERAGPPARGSHPDNQIFCRIGKNGVYVSFFGSMIISQKLSPLHMAREIRIWYQGLSALMIDCT